MQSQITPLKNYRAVPIHPVVNRMTKNTQSILSWLLWHRNYKTGQCNPRIETLAEDVGCSITTVVRSLRELRASGIIRIKRSQRSSSYEITDQSNWITVKHRMRTRQMSLFPAPAKPVEQPPAQPVTNQGMSTSAYAEMTILNSRFLYELLKLFLNYRPVPAAAEKTTESSEPVTRQTPAAATMGGLKAQQETPARTAAEALVAELMPQHPEPGNEPQAIIEATKILSSKPDETTATVETIRNAHTACRARWADYAPGRFIPQLQKWLRDGDWKHIRPERKEVRRETWVERRKREYQEAEDKTYRMYAEMGMWDAIREYSGEEAVEVWREKIKRVA